jgi:putative hydrolase of the HAD superfamily
MNIKAVVFDFGNVLGFFSHRRAAEQLALHAPAGVTADDLLTFLGDSDLEIAYEEGRLSTAEVLLKLRQRYDLRGSDEQLERAAADMFTPNEPMCALVPLLRKQYRLVLLSNTNDLHYRQFRLQFAGTLDHFHALVVSHEVGVRKPDPAAYHHARERAGCLAAECLFIDDLPANVVAARACGWQSVLYRKDDDPRQLLLRAGVSLMA